MFVPRMFLILCLLLGIAVLPLVRGEEPEKKSERQVELEKSLRLLEKEIEKARGLAFKKPVVARIIPRPKEVAPGLQGYYSTKDKALTVYDDVKGNYEKGVLIAGNLRSSRLSGLGGYEFDLRVDENVIRWGVIRMWGISGYVDRKSGRIDVLWTNDDGHDENSLTRQFHGTCQER